MGLLNILGKEVVLPNFNYQTKYWPIISRYAKKFVAEEANYDPSHVQSVLKGCFTLLCDQLKIRISELPEASFFIFCHGLHEDSIELWELQIEKVEIPVDEEQFAASRRALKIILEHGCSMRLKGHPYLKTEILAKKDSYIVHLEELLYMCNWAMVFSEYISRSQLFPKSTGIQIIDDELNILTKQPYPELFKFMFNEMPKHNTGVQVSNCLVEFKKMLQKDMSMSYDILGGFTVEHISNPDYKYSIAKIEPMIDYISAEYGYDKDVLKNFYAGLTVTRNNVLPIEDRILRNQDSRRYMVRPILEYIIDDEIYNLVGYKKWSESLTVLSTNGIPFNQYPEEWKNSAPIKQFVKEVTAKADKILEDRIQKILEDNNIKFDNSIKSLTNRKGNNIVLTIKGVGEIDLIFIREDVKILYVGEAKHNRSRFDMNNWKRDYSNFTNTYENQLRNKVNWVKLNIKSIAEHLNAKYDSNLNLEDYEVEGAFFINAPTAYMFDGVFRAFTLVDLQSLIAGKFVDTTFVFTKGTGESFSVSYPYFKNLERFLN